MRRLGVERGHGHGSRASSLSLSLNQHRWQSAKFTRGPEFAPVAKRLVAAKASYQEIKQIAGVPWFVIAVVHQREALQRWDCSIAQDDPSTKV